MTVQSETSAHTQTTTSQVDTRRYVDGEKYLLPVDKQEGNRLELQHKVLKAAYGGELLLAPHEKDVGYFVLEIGTGTAAWLIDLASSLPSTAILHGIDIDTSRLPAVSSYPSNISFSLGSVLSLPDTWTSRFDYAHQRLLTCALVRADWRRALAELRRVLRPGGWVQIGEYGRKDADSAHADGGKWPAMAKWALKHQELYKREELLYRAYDELPVLLKEAGFVDVRIERRTIPLGAWAGQGGKDASENLGVFYRAIKARMVKHGDMGTEEELEEMIKAVEKERDAVPGTETDFFIVCAQNPR